MVVGLIAGGEKAFIEAVEGAEDSRELAVEDLKAHGLTANDFVVGIAASGRTPYVLGGLDYAKSVGCHTAAIACNIGSAIGKAAELAITKYILLLQVNIVNYFIFLQVVRTLRYEQLYKTSKLRVS